MTFLLKNATVYYKKRFSRLDVLVEDGIIISISTDIHPLDGVYVFDMNNYYIFPGFADVHVHFREPGFLYKESIKTGSMAAAHGGYTDVCTMPNLSPVPDSVEHLKVQLDAIKKDAVINVYPYGSISVGELGTELTDIAGMAKDAIAFSDDGRGVQSQELMFKAMEQAKKYNKIIAAHCEDNSLLFGGYIHKGEYAKLHNHAGICSESEYGPITRDVELVKKSGCKYHVCHISTKESVDIIRKAKAEGVDITCETAPHYLTMNDMMLKEEGRFKMNPPIRSEEDRLALIEGVLDGTIDMIATDHAPHSAEEKSKGLKDSLMGVVGLETAFAVIYTKLVKPGVISLDKLIELMHDNPCKRFGIGTDIEIGNKANFTVFDLESEFTVDPSEFLSMGKSTPFDGETLSGKCLMTVANGEVAFKEDKI